MLKEYNFILYNAKDENVNENIFWMFLCTEWTPNMIINFKICFYQK